MGSILNIVIRKTLHRHFLELALKHKYTLQTFRGDMENLKIVLRTDTLLLNFNSTSVAMCSYFSQNHQKLTTADFHYL